MDLHWQVLDATLRWLRAWPTADLALSQADVCRDLIRIWPERTYDYEGNYRDFGPSPPWPTTTWGSEVTTKRLCATLEYRSWISYFLLLHPTQGVFIRSRKTCRRHAVTHGLRCSAPAIVSSWFFCLWGLLYPKGIQIWRTAFAMVPARSYAADYPLSWNGQAANKLEDSYRLRWNSLTENMGQCSRPPQWCGTTGCSLFHQQRITKYKTWSGLLRFLPSHFQTSPSRAKLRQREA